jgi:pimeloyl-ACP methyl ester carboxylesterase
MTMRSRRARDVPAAILCAALLPLATASSARAQEAVRFLVRGPAETIGREVYTVEPGPGPGQRTVVARTAAEFLRGGSMMLRQRLVLDLPGRPPRYEVEIETPSGAAIARASGASGNLLLEASEAGLDSVRSRSVPWTANASLIDPFFANHYQWLLDGLLAAGPRFSVADSVTIITPQSLEVRAVAVHELQGEVGSLEGRNVTLRCLRLDIPRQSTLVWFDSQTGRLCRVRLENQWLELVREGFRPSPSDTVLPVHAAVPLDRPAYPDSGRCGRVSLQWPPSTRAHAIAILHPDGGPPGAMPDSFPLMDLLGRALLVRDIAVLRIEPDASACGGASEIKRGWMNPALDALHALTSECGVDPGRIFLVGHGLGATAAAGVAARDTSGLAGVALLGAPARMPREWIADRLRACREGAGPASRSAAQTDLGWSPQDWAEMEAFDARSAVAGMVPPVLVVQGALDCETGGRRAASAFARALQSAERGDAQFEVLAGVDHAFRDPAPPDRGDALAPALARDVSLWIRSMVSFGATRPGPGR